MTTPMPPVLCGRAVCKLALASVLALSSTAPWAGPSHGSRHANTTAKAAATPAQMAVLTAATAHRLVRYGDARRDALALITGARMLQMIGSQASPARRDGPAATETKPGGDRFLVESVLRRARSLANGRSDLLALADDVAAVGTRGAVNGPHRWTEVVSSSKNDLYRVTFRGGEPAAIALSGDGDSDLDLYVYDENGNLVCKDEGDTDDAVCHWTPKWTGQFTVKIRNLGLANQYVAAHN